MGLFNRDFRSFDNNSIDTAAMFESAWETTLSGVSATACSFSADSWNDDSYSAHCSSSWNSSND